MARDEVCKHAVDQPSLLRALQADTVRGFYKEERQQSSNETCSTRGCGPCLAAPQAAKGAAGARKSYDVPGGLFRIPMAAFHACSWRTPVTHKA